MAARIDEVDMAKIAEFDVVIVGAGPAGYMAATWFARIGGLKVKFIEKRDTKIFVGQADGLQSRTLEVMHSFGFGDRVWKESSRPVATHAECGLTVSEII